MIDDDHWRRWLGERRRRRKRKRKRKWPRDFGPDEASARAWAREWWRQHARVAPLSTEPVGQSSRGEARN